MDDESNDDYKDLDVLAYKVRDAYRAKKNEIFGKPTQINPRHDKMEFWRNAAKICLEEAIDPAQFIEMVFAKCPNPRTLYPNMLFGNMAKEAVNELTVFPLEEILDIEVGHIVSALKRLTGGYDLNKYKEYIMDSSWPCYAFIRVMIIPNDEDVIKAYGREALDTFNNTPATKQVAIKRGFKVEQFIEEMHKRGYK
jgi:hypothetical protein